MRLVIGVVILIAVIRIAMSITNFVGRLFAHKYHEEFLAEVDTLMRIVMSDEQQEWTPLTRFQREIVQNVKCKHGVPKEGESNREVIRRAIVAEIFSDENRMRTFRRTDMIHHVTVMMACVFTPTDHEIGMSRAEHDVVDTSALYDWYRYIRCAIGRPLPVSLAERKASYVRAVN
jgi:hypothetical protein